MDIIELGAIGELVGGLAVLITLIYLALQVRQGNQNERAAAHRSWVAEFNRCYLEPLRDPAIAPLARRLAADFDRGDGNEQLIVGTMWASLILMGQEAYFLFRRQSLDEEIAKIIDFTICSFLLQPGPKQWWAFAQKAFTPVYTTYINGLLADPDRPPAMNDLLPYYAEGT